MKQNNSYIQYHIRRDEIKIYGLKMQKSGKTNNRKLKIKIIN